MIRRGVCAPKLVYIGMCLLDYKLYGYDLGSLDRHVAYVCVRLTLSCGCVCSDSAGGRSAGSACSRVNSQPGRELHVTIPDPHIEARTTTGRLRYTYDD